MESLLGFIGVVLLCLLVYAHRIAKRLDEIASHHRSASTSSPDGSRQLLQQDLDERVASREPEA